VINNLKSRIEFRQKTQSLMVLSI